jgi:hypothetical protein
MNNRSIKWELVGSGKEQYGGGQKGGVKTGQIG